MLKQRLPIVFTGLLIGGCATSVGDRAPGDATHVDFDRIPDAVPRVEPRSRYGNPPEYEVAGKRYRVLAGSKDFVQRGTASWYGMKFHGRRTSSGEPYDLYAMTAAHKELPLPSYVRVTSLETGKSVVVRVNDRGPFHGDRIIDLSYAAAHKLGFAGRGTAEVEIRALDPRAPKSMEASAASEPLQGVPAQLTAAAALGAPQALLPLSGQPATAAAPMDTVGVTANPKHAVAAGTAPVQTGEVLYLQVGAFGDRANAERLRERLKAAGTPVTIAEADAASPLHRVWVGPLRDTAHAVELTEQLVALGVSSPRVIRRGSPGL